LEWIDTAGKAIAAMATNRIATDQAKKEKEDEMKKQQQAWTNGEIENLPSQPGGADTSK
jgi:hypothetical protein